MTAALTVDALPPHDVGAEEACVAACLLDQEAVLVLIGAGLQPADFYDHLLGRLYASAITLSERNEQLDYLTLEHEARDFIHEGGEHFLLSLMTRHFTAVGVEAHARMVMRDAQYRRLIDAGARVVRLGYEGGPDVSTALEESRAWLNDIESGGVNSGGTLIEQYIANDIPEDDRLLVTTGYPALDRAIRGCAAGELICLGARTDQGKTALAVGMAYRQAAAGVPVAYLPVEGSVGGVLHRMAAIKARVSLGYLEHLKKSGREQDGEDQAYWHHYADLVDLPVVVPTKEDGTPRRTQAILSWITRQVRQFSVKVVYIDHIDAIALDLARGQNAAGAYADFLKRLQDVAGREQISIVFLSQVNRESNRLEGKTPPMGYMRESGSKEEASQTVLMLGLEDDSTDNNSLTAQGGHVGRWLWVNVDKVKDYPGNRNIGSRSAPDRPVLWLDSHSGAVRQIGEVV